MNPGLSSFGTPPDAAAWGALGLAALVMALALQPKPRRQLVVAWLTTHPRRTVWALALGAALLSWLWIVVYLRGGPRIIDATAYYLQGRMLAAGQLVFEPVGGLGSHQGRFLIAPPDRDVLGVIFPPGYPALLALAFLLGHPLALGPVLAALLVVVTYELALKCFDDPRAALLAAALSACCGALRYHTADTMSHGFSALLLAAALLASLSRPRWGLAAGLCLGWLAATRPVTAAVGLLLVLVSARSRPAFWWRAAIGLVPGVTLLLAHQRALTGAWLESSQRRYYALADSPPGCFRYGFGDDVGCRFEHGEFVSRYLDGGYGPLEALGTTGRRLLWHALDVGNAEPLAWLLLLGVVLGLRLPAVRLLGLGVVAIVIGYAPFYFDGSYPGGGARLFADVLPLEHALLGWTLLRLRVARWALPVSLLGFAVRASYGHVGLREREGGRPLFEPAALAAAAPRGLLFVDTDHGYLLAQDPSQRDPTQGWVTARRRGDTQDGSLWNALGRPPAFVYRHDFGGGPPSVARWQPAESARIEAETLWPLRSVVRGSAHPAPGGACTNGRVLRVWGDEQGGAVVSLAPVPPARAGLSLWWHPRESGKVTVKATWNGARSEDEINVISGTCFMTPVDPGASPEEGGALRLELSGAGLDLDALELTPR